ncbi:MAG: heparinase II/III family protein, partial [Terriglobia bacterium]
YKVPFLDFNVVGDHKIVWELNRHQHLVTLAKAYCLTRQERFIAELIEQWQHWREENPYPTGINWASSLEVAFRTLSWIWVSQLLAGSFLVPEAFHSDLTRALALNGRHIERYLSTYWSPNTHLLGEAVALLFIGVLCPALRSALRWRELGWRIVLEQAERQVEPDGTHFESSLYYHVYALDFFLHARILAAANLIPVPEAMDRALVKMMELLCGISQAGPAPRFGDDDGGRLFDPSRNWGRRLLDPLSIGAVLFDREDFKAASRGLTEETVWLLGAEAATRFDAFPLGARPLASRSFPAGGLYVMASGEANSGPPAEHLSPPSGAPPLQLVIRAGRVGGGNSGHGHADALSVHLSAGGEEWLTDPGTFRYISAGPEREYFQSTAAHNTL